MEQRVFDTDKIDHRQAYRLCIGSIVPRPIAWVSSIDASGVANLAPFSFFTLVSHHPPMVSISVGEREHRAKDTAANIEATKGFVIHTVVEGWEAVMNESAANFDPAEDEFAEIGLDTVPADLVAAPRIKDAPVAMECEWERTLEFGEEWHTHCVIGRILRWHISEDLMIDDKYIDPHKLTPIGRLGGPRYCRTRDIFEMEPTYALPDRADPNAPQPERGKAGGVGRGHRA